MFLEHKDKEHRVLWMKSSVQNILEEVSQARTTKFKKRAQLMVSKIKGQDRESETHLENQVICVKLLISI